MLCSDWRVEYSSFELGLKYWVRALSSFFFFFFFVNKIINKTE